MDYDFTARAVKTLLYRYFVLLPIAPLLQVSVYIVEGGEGKDKQMHAPVFRDFIMKFRAIIDSPVSSHRELTVAIKGYGYFAAVSQGENITVKPFSDAPCLAYTQLYIMYY